MRACRTFVFCVAAALLWGAGSAWAEWATQTITLRPGWNAVFLEVEPEDRTCDTIFAGIPIRSVWSWNRELQLKQFVTDPSKLLPESPDWLVYFPKNEARAFLSDLFALRGGQPYLIEYGGDQPFEWTLQGTTGASQPKWLPDSFNLAGFYLDPAAPASFKNFFQYDSALDGQPMFRMDSTGQWVPVNPAADTLRPGEAYWVYANGRTEYAGPASVKAAPVTGLDFGKDANESYLLLTNATPEPKTFTLRVLPTERPAGAKDADTQLPVSGDVALSYKRLLAWEPVGETLTLTVSPNAEERLVLAVRRGAMQSALKSAGEGQFESVVQITDGAGTRYRLPAKAVADTSPAGLWVGSVKLDAVSEAYRPNDLTATPAAGPFSFRLMVHVDELGNAKLLNKVYLMQVQATFDNSQTPPVELTPAHYVLLTRDDLVPQYTGVALRDGEIVGRRITSPVFSFTDPVALVGNTTPGATLKATITVPYTDPLNPFLHKYHPDHNNLDERFVATLPEGKESFTFSRAVTLSFTAQDPEALGLPEWGYSLIGGTYQEDVTGVHKRPIRVQGTFKLTKVTSVNVLNDGQ